MTVRLNRVGAVGAVLVAAATLLSAAPVQDVPLETLLERLGAYVAGYERALTAVVSEEAYVQEVTGAPTLFATNRALRSEFLLAKATGGAGGEAGWVAFRDVFEVDGIPVQDRSDRLIDLFLKPPADAWAQVNRIVEESAKHNLGGVRRTVNVPTMVLQFARTTEQPRSQFRRGSRTTLGGHQVRELRFSERATPRMITTSDGAAAQGTFWIDEATGRVHRTEMRIITGNLSATIGVSYAHQDELDLWLPVLMSERYVIPRQPTITGRAVYGNFRRFNVTVDTVIKK